MDGKKIYEMIENTDFEESILGRLDMEYATKEDIIKKLNGMDLEWIIDEHCAWHGMGIDSSDIKWMLDMLGILREDEWDDRTES